MVSTSFYRFIILADSSFEDMNFIEEAGTLLGDFADVGGAALNLIFFTSTSSFYTEAVLLVMIADFESEASSVISYPFELELYITCGFNFTFDLVPSIFKVFYDQDLSKIVCARFF